MYREEDIIKWAANKGILSGGDKLTQALKTCQEVSELNDNVLKGLNVSDDIGDIYVTIVIQANMQETEMSSCIESLDTPAFDVDNIKYLVADLEFSSGYMAQLLASEDYGLEDVSIAIAVVYKQIEAIAKYYKLNFNDCVDEAYNEIMGRTGKMVDGVFVKD